MKWKLFFVFVVLSFVIFSLSCTNRNKRTKIVLPKKAAKQETLAAKEVRRYIYQRTGQLLTIIYSDSLDVSNTDIILAARKDRPVFQYLQDENLKKSISELAEHEYILRTIDHQGIKILLLCGGDEIGTLYSAYKFAEHLGIRFYLHGDVIPDEKIRFQLPNLDETLKPLFSVRGIQPFHDFPEGPDWWNSDDYKAIFSQLPKLRMNFFGLHTYPEGSVGPEPTVWIGMEKDHNKNGTVGFSYPARHFTTSNITGSWGYRNRKTGDYSFGADQLFERDDFGADYMKGMNPWPKLSVEQSNELFNRVGSLLNEVFSYAKNMGIQTCIGTEIPLVIPGPVQDRLESAGQDPDNPGVISDLYESMFKRIIQTHPLDYYWFWTPEGWTWKGNTKEQIEKTKNDMAAAIAAANNVQAPFTLATCGWVLGPKQDRSMFDKFLPKEMPISCINREVGFTPVETGFSEVKNRPKWAIPWLEDDPAMIIPQLWAGRMRKDAADALIYGCTGLIGIHWRTRILGPNISALAKAAWEQEAWNPSFGDPSREKSDKSRDLTVEEFYNDWAFTQFGREAADPIAEIFIRLDGSSEIQEKNPRKSNLPRPSDWNKGPGGIFPDSRKWEEVSPEYDFILEIEKLRPHVFGKGNLERFDYWLNNFRYMKAIGRFNCTLQEMIEKMNKVKEENDPQLRKNLVQKLVLPIRKRQMAELEEIHKYLLATVNTTGGLGMVANWQQHNIPMHIDPISKELKAISGKDLPEDAMPSKKYPGKVRMFVPTIRTCLEAGEPLHLKIILLGDKSRKAFLYWKPIGENNFEKLKLTYVERGVYRVTIPSEAITEDFEYYIQMITMKNETLVFPVTAPKINQTIVVF